jgi:hypothetical protein
LRDAVVAFQAAFLGAALEALGRFAWGGPYLPELMAQKLFALIPAWAFTPLFRTFGYNSKYHAFAGMIAAELGGLTLAGAMLRKWLRRRMADRNPAWAALAIAGPLTAGILIGALPLLDAGVAGRALSGGMWLAMLSAVLLAGSYAAVVVRGLHR